MELQTAVTIFLVVIFTISGGKTFFDTLNTDSGLENQTVKVVDVADGDTLDIQMNGETETVRVLGLDTPEVTGANTPSEFFLEDTSENRRCLRDMGEKASQLAKQELSGKQVKIVTDPESDRRGSYGRLLAYIEYNKTSLGKEMLQRGYARVYNSSFTRIDRYRKLETESRREGRGIWNESCGSR